MANRRLKITRLYPVAMAILAALQLGACAVTPTSTSRLLPLKGKPAYAVPDIDVQEVTPEMEEFLHRYVSRADNPDGRAWNLVWATTDRSVLPFRYDPAVTLTSAEAFERKTGNCLAFANMLVAMARNQGLRAWYQEVETPPRWTSSNSTLLISMHINVVLQGRHDDWVVDISGENNVTSPRRIRRIDDREALAQYYNNLGAEALIEEDLASAFAYYAKAIDTAPRLPYLWSNIGVVYNRNGQTRDAIQAYQKALQLDPGHSVAANNLYMIYEQLGDSAAAERIEARVERHRRRNPYYLYYLSSQAAEQGNYEESTAMLRKAIRMNEDEYRFYYELARLQASHGDLEQAQASLDRAQDLAPDGSPISGTSLDDLPDLPE